MSLTQNIFKSKIHNLFNSKYLFNLYSKKSSSHSKYLSADFCISAD